MGKQSIALFASSAIFALLALSLLYSNSKNWSIDNTSTFFNSGASSAKQIFSPQNKVFAVNGKNVVLPSWASASALEKINGTPEFQRALASESKIELVDAQGVRAIITNLSGRELNALSSNDETNNFFSGAGVNTSAIKASALPERLKIANVNASASSAAAYSASTASGAIPVLASKQASGEALSNVASTQEFQDALKDAQFAEGQKLFLYQDPATGERVVIPQGFSSEELAGLQASSALASSIDAQAIPAGQAIDLQQTPPYAGLPVSSLPSNPRAQPNIPFDPLSSISGTGFQQTGLCFILPAILSVLLAVVYFLAGKFVESGFEAKRRQRARAVTELQALPKPGASFSKGEKLVEKEISLPPLFTVQVIDNFVSEEGGEVIFALANVSQEAVKNIQLLSGLTEKKLGSLEPGEKATVRLETRLQPSDETVSIFMRFEAVRINGMVYVSREFKIPVQRL